jgi:CheY-specific phosphatase CheX
VRLCISFAPLSSAVPQVLRMTLFEIVRHNPVMLHHIQEAVFRALKIYAHSDIVPKAHFFKSHTADSEITIIGLMEITENTKTNFLALGFSQTAFLGIYENMFREKLTDVSLESADLAGELLNIIFQTIDPELRKLGHKFDVSLPKVLTKSNTHEWIQTHADQSLVLPFSTECGDILFEIFETKG